MEMPGPEDDERVSRAVAGDLDVLDELLREAAPAVRAGLSIDPLWSRSFDRDDVLQVSFLEAYLRIRTLRILTRSGFRSWLARIAANNLRDAVRGLEREKRPDARRRVTRGPEGQSARTLLASILDETPTASGQVARREEVARLRAVIERLPESYRHVIEAVDLEERPVADVAVELGRRVGAVHMLRSRAHDRLRQLLTAPDIGDSCESA